MNDPKTSKPDTPPTPERDTSREGREEEVINQLEQNDITNSQANTIVNDTPSNDGKTGEQQFKEGTFHHEVTLDEADRDYIDGSDRTGAVESTVPGSGI